MQDKKLEKKIIDACPKIPGCFANLGWAKEKEMGRKLASKIFGNSFQRKQYGFKILRSSEDMAKILYDLKIVSSIEDGKKLMPLFDYETVGCVPDNCLDFTKVKNFGEKEVYLIDFRKREPFEDYVADFDIS